MHRDLSRTYFCKIKELYDFASQQVVAGLFKSDIMDKLVELGVDRYLAFDVLEEMERRLSNMRKRVVALAISETEQREALRKEFRISGYAIVLYDDMVTLKKQLLEKVPDLVIADAFDFNLKGREVLNMLRSHIVGRQVPVFVLTEEEMGEEDFKKWERVWVFEKPCDVDGIARSANKFFLKKFLGEDGEEAASN